MTKPFLLVFVECPEDNNPPGSARSLACEKLPRRCLSNRFPNRTRETGSRDCFKKIGKPFPEKGTQQASEEGSTARKEVPMVLDCSVQLPYAPQV